MLVHELQQALDALVLALDADDYGQGPEAALPHLQQAHLVLTYARAALSAELDGQAACLVDEVLCGLTDTVGRLLVARTPTPADCCCPDGAAAAQLAEWQGCAAQQQHHARQPHKRQHQQSAGPTDTSTHTTIDLSHQLQLDPPHRQQQQQQQPGCERHGEADDAAGSSAAAVAAAESVEILQCCQRAVSGTLSEISGLKDVKQELVESVLWPLRLPSLFKGYRKPPRSFLFAGPPGTGKTMLVEKLAAESGMVMLVITPSNCLSKWSGESEKIIRSVFAAASSMQPSIVFIDEVDALAGQRSSGDDAASRRLLTELLLQMTAAAGQDVFIFACTNRIQDCDAALLRRFERRIFIPLPDPAARLAFFAKALQRSEMAHSLSKQDVDAVVERTHGYSCSELQGVCRSAAMLPVRELLAAQPPAAAAAAAAAAATAPTWLESGAADEEPPDMCPRPLCLQDFVTALATIKPTSADQASFAMP